MRITVTVRLYPDFPAVVKFELWNSNPSRSASIRFVFILHEDDRVSSFERYFNFHFPRVIRNELRMILLGVAYTAAIFDGILRGLEIGVIEPEEPVTDVDFDVTSEWPREG
jgi:hypothetical protein